MKKKKKMFISLIISIAAIFVILGSYYLIPITPENAIRLRIVEDFHPINTAKASPKKVSDGVSYTGKNSWSYYSIRKHYVSDTEGSEIHVLGVSKGSLFYKAHFVYPVG
ncbi:hypothetical protein [Lactiplantibacillus fabifermentans]|uniref:hypothetical protein n=1 Tax=Lactiplantibacillus fabifermentans TaxID=483011 RepID=UPI0004670E4F|nr:hypothetical protein [Lactiplantibacillus fabifermentans]